jgi:hypothetical protein
VSARYSESEIAEIRRFDDTAARLLKQCKSVTSLKELNDIIATQVCEESLRYKEPLHESHTYLGALKWSLLNSGHLVLRPDRKLELGTPYKKQRFRKPTAVRQHQVAFGPRGRLSGLAG